MPAVCWSHLLVHQYMLETTAAFVEYCCVFCLVAQSCFGIALKVRGVCAMMMSDVEAQDVFSLSPTSESESMADIGFRAAHSLDIVPAHKNPKSLHANPRGKIYLFQRYSPFRSGPTACGILVYIIYMHTHTHSHLYTNATLPLPLSPSFST